MRGKGSYWRERERERERVCLFCDAWSKRIFFGCEKKRREKRTREEDKGDVVKCCYV
jgi:hypothetical protein